MEAIQTLDTVITSVTVYREGALIRRTGSVKASKSKEKISRNVMGLPLALRDETVRAGIFGEKTSSRITDIGIVLDIPELASEDNPHGTEELKEAERTVGRLKEELGETEAAISRRETTDWPERPVTKNPAAAISSPFAERAAYAENINRRRADLLKKKRDIKNRLSEASEKLELLRNRELTASAEKERRRNEIRKAVVLTMDSAGAEGEDVGIFLEYLIPGARWVPTYALRFDAVFAQAVLETRALVCQRSGEDWSGAALTLSTAFSGQWRDLPELNSRRIGRAARGRSKKGWKEAPIGTQELFSDYKSFFDSRIGGFIPAAAPISQRLPDEDDYDIEDDDYDEEIFEDTEDYEYEERRMEIMKSSAPPSVHAAKKRRSESMELQMAASMEMKDSEKEFISREPGNDLLDYAALRLPDPEETGFSELHPATRRELYAEKAGALSAKLDSAVWERLESAESSAETLAAVPPQGCRYPTDVDGFDYVYKTAVPVSVESDGRFHSIPVRTAQVPVAVRYISVPRIDSTVFAAAEFKNEDEAPLPAGPVDVSVESTPLLTTHLETIPSGGTTILGLGAEEGIKIARNTHFEEKTSGLAGTQLTLHHEILIDAVNNLSRPVELEVRERIPVRPDDQGKAEEKVKIELTKTEPVWERYEEETDYLRGGYRWKLSLAAGEKTKLLAEYDIQIPSNTEIPDGNNREAE